MSYRMLKRHSIASPLNDAKLRSETSQELDGLGLAYAARAKSVRFALALIVSQGSFTR